MPDTTGQPSRRRRIVLLAGAHKTASSHLQSSLMAEQAAIRAEGVALAPPRVHRRSFTPLLQQRKDGAPLRTVQDAAAALANDLAGTAATLVIMDENILGGTSSKMLLAGRRLYRWAPNRLAQLAALFPGHSIDIGLGIRDPADFLPSCWSETIRLGGYQDFRSYLGGVDPLRLSWADLLQRIAAEVPHARLFVWCYEDYAHIFDSVCTRVMGPNAARHALPLDRTIRPGLSAAAVAWLESLAAPQKPDIRIALRRYPKRAAADAYDPWSAAERAALNRRYARDRAELRQSPGLQWLRP
jgi:hypothetical protein